MNTQQHRFSIETFDEDFPIMNRIAYEHLNHAMKALQDETSKWGWLQVTPPEIHFQHMCLYYEQSVFCILLALVEDGNITLPDKVYDNLLRECDENGMTPCLFLIDSVTGSPYLPSPYLMNARSQEIIDFKDYDNLDPKPMSPWEINNAGILAVVQKLQEEGTSYISYCDVIGIEPQIWFEKDGVKSYVFLRSIPKGLEDEKYKFNTQYLKEYANFKGYFADVRWTHFFGFDGISPAKEIYRGPFLFHENIELIEIEKAIKKLPFIEPVTKKFYTLDSD